MVFTLWKRDIKAQTTEYGDVLKAGSISKFNSMVMFDLLNSLPFFKEHRFQNKAAWPSLTKPMSSLLHMLRSLCNQQQNRLSSFELLRVKWGARQTRDKVINHWEGQVTKMLTTTKIKDLVSKLVPQSWVTFQPELLVPKTKAGLLPNSHSSAESIKPNPSNTLLFLFWQGEKLLKFCKDFATLVKSGKYKKKVRKV